MKTPPCTRQPVFTRTPATTLLDPAAYPIAALGELYFQRWGVELHCREIKATLGMDGREESRARKRRKTAVSWCHSTLTPTASTRHKCQKVWTDPLP